MAKADPGSLTNLIFGGTKRSSKVAKRLGPAARKGGGGAATVARVTNFLARGGGPTANFVNKSGRTQLGRKGKAGGGGKKG